MQSNHKSISRPEPIPAVCLYNYNSKNFDIVDDNVYRPIIRGIAWSKPLYKRVCNTNTYIIIRYSAWLHILLKCNVKYCTSSNILLHHRWLMVCMAGNLWPCVVPGHNSYLVNALQWTITIFQYIYFSSNYFIRSAIWL